jgi:hypothetical protein
MVGRSGYDRDTGAGADLVGIAKYPLAMADIGAGVGRG